MNNDFNNQSQNDQQLNGMQGGNMGNQQMYQSNPNPNAYGQPMYGPTNSMPNYGPNMGKLPNFVTYLILSIAECLCCCFITGLLGIIFSCMANSSWNNGLTNDAYSKLRTAKILLIVGLIIGLVVCTCSGIVSFSGVLSTDY